MGSVDDLVISGGDERIALDPATGLNKYLCPPGPCPDVTCLSSCTASPISALSFEAASSLHKCIASATAIMRATVVADAAHLARRRIARALGVEGLAEIVVCPSGTDAMLTASVLLAVEQPDRPMTMVLPTSSETGTGVPVAVRGRPFAVADWDAAPLLPQLVGTVNIPLRDAETGEPRPEAEVSRDFARAAASAAGRAIVVLTHGTKTGLIVPAEPPSGEDVIVDACQARITPKAIRAYLSRGGPVVVTGSKFYGGPAFSGAVLMPVVRWRGGSHLPAGLARHAAVPGRRDGQDTNFGMVLRWEAALAEMEGFSSTPLAGARVASHARVVEARLRSSRDVVLIDGLSRHGPVWSEAPTIFTIAIRNPNAPHRIHSAVELRGIYLTLAREGVLLGQPVDLGPFGGLRIAIGARDARVESLEPALDQLFDRLRWMALRPNEVFVHATRQRA